MARLSEEENVLSNNVKSPFWCPHRRYRWKIGLIRRHAWLEEGHRAFVLNLANVPYVDSFGLGQLITILALIRSKGGQLVLLELTDHVLALFAITKLNTVFSISVEEAHAIESVRIP